jgi:hypothetical protein
MIDNGFLLLDLDRPRCTHIPAFTAPRTFGHIDHRPDPDQPGEHSAYETRDQREFPVVGDPELVRRNILRRKSSNGDSAERGLT